MHIYMQVRELDNVEYVEEETMAYSAGYTVSWALDRIDQRDNCYDHIYDAGAGRHGHGVDIYILDTG